MAWLLEGSACYWYVMQPGGFEKGAFKLHAIYARRGNAGGAWGPILLLLILPPAWWLYRLMLRGARSLRLTARRLALESAPEAVAADPRSPVLFLRAFAHEQVPLRGAPVPWLLRTFDPGTEYGTLEDMIVHELAYKGPVVTLADPKRDELPVGAARWRVDGQSWQGFVESQMERAGLIVVSIADTAGVRWEVDAPRSAQALDNTVFLFRPESTQDLPLLSSLCEWLEIPPPVDEVLGPNSGRNVLALAMPSERPPVVVVARGLSEIDYQVALRVTVEQPV